MALVGSFSVIVKSLRKFVESSSRERSVCLSPAVAVSGWRCDRDRRTDKWWCSDVINGNHDSSSRPRQPQHSSSSSHSKYSPRPYIESRIRDDEIVIVGRSSKLVATGLYNTQVTCNVCIYPLSWLTIHTAMHSRYLNITKCRNMSAVTMFPSFNVNHIIHIILCCSANYANWYLVICCRNG